MKRNFMKMKMLGLTAMLALAGLAGATAPTPTGPLSDADIAAKAAHEIRMYSRYSIWDNVNLRIHDGAVELVGQVSQPYKKQDLQRIMQRVPGVTAVINNLEVLPLSPNDDHLRLRVARAIYRDPALSRYGIQAVPPIHIIVKNGEVTLEGVVNNEMEKNVAAIRAASAGLGERRCGSRHHDTRSEKHQGRKRPRAIRAALRQHRVLENDRRGIPESADRHRHRPLRAEDVQRHRPARSGSLRQLRPPQHGADADLHGTQGIPPSTEIRVH